MSSSKQKVWESIPIYAKFTKVFMHFACRASVASTAFMQLPAILLASCTAQPAAHEAPLRLRAGGAAAGHGLDLFFFDAKEPFLLDSYQRVSAGEESVYALSGQGRRRIVALSSSERDYSGVTRFKDLSRASFSLEDDSPRNPLGYVDCIIEEGASRSMDLILLTLLCTVRVRSVSCDVQFHSDSLFIVNAVSEFCPLAAGGGRPVSWLNHGAAESTNPFVSAPGLGIIGKERIYPSLSLYCYPNPGANPPTRLVLEGTVGDARCYYPIDLVLARGGICLDLDITIHRMGTADPDTPASPGIFTVEYSTVPWYEMDTVIETY